MADGLSILQMFSLMQDGGQDVTHGTNRVHYPQRPKFTFSQTLSNQKELNAKVDQLLSNPSIPNRLAVDTYPNYMDRKTGVYFSKEFDLGKLKAKAKSLGVSVNDIFMGSVAKAVSDVSPGH